MSQPAAPIEAEESPSILKRICFCCYQSNLSKEPPVQLIRSGSIKPSETQTTNGHISPAQHTIDDIEEVNSMPNSSREPALITQQATSAETRNGKKKDGDDVFHLNDIMLDDICADETDHKVEDGISISTDVVEAVDDSELTKMNAKPDKEMARGEKEEARKMTIQEFLEEERIRGSEGTQSSMTQSKVETSRAHDEVETRHAPVLILNNKSEEEEEESGESEDEIMVDDSDIAPSHSPPAVPNDQSPAHSPRHSTDAAVVVVESADESSPPLPASQPPAEISADGSRQMVEVSRMYGGAETDGNSSDDERSSASEAPRQRVASGNSPRLQKMKPISFPPNSADSSIVSSEAEEDPEQEVTGEEEHKTESEKENRSREREDKSERKGPLTRISVKSNGTAEIHSYVDGLDSQREAVTDEEFPEKLI